MARRQTNCKVLGSKGTLGSNGVFGGTGGGNHDFIDTLAEFNSSPLLWSQRDTNRILHPFLR